MNLVTLHGKIRNALEEFEELRRLDDGIGNRCIFDQLLLMQETKVKTTNSSQEALSGIDTMAHFLQSSLNDKDCLIVNTIFLAPARVPVVGIHRSEHGRSWLFLH
jgi:hypothetical protein